MDKGALTLIAGFLIGILTASFVAPSQEVLLLSLLITITLFFLSVLLRQSAYAYIALLVLGLCIGIGRIVVTPQTLPPSFETHIGTSVSFVGKIVQDPDVRERNQRVVVDIKEEDESTKVLVVAPLYPSLSYGETVQVTGTFTRPENFETGEGRMFDYENYLLKDGIFSMITYGEVDVLKEREGIDVVYGSLVDVKRWGMEALSRALPEPHASLAGGLILGGKQGLGSELVDALMRSGLIHIVVLSGYNVMIVAEFVLRVFRTVLRRWASVVAGIAIVLFVLGAGAGAASIRAGIMAGIALYGRATGKTYHAFRALIVAGVAMLLTNPYVLLFDPGFQLSFIATLGLIFGAPIVERFLVKIKSTFFREIIASTIAAQIAVLPLLLYQNGLLSLVSLPANLMVLPLIPFAMLFSALALLVGGTASIIAPAVSLPAYVLLSYVLQVAKTAALVPFGGINVPPFSFVVVGGAYVVLIVLVLRFSTPRPR